eukprot:gene1718-1066_t
MASVVVDFGKLKPRHVSVRSIQLTTKAINTGAITNTNQTLAAPRHSRSFPLLHLLPPTTLSRFTQPHAPQDPRRSNPPLRDPPSANTTIFAPKPHKTPDESGAPPRSPKNPQGTTKPATSSSTADPRTHPTQKTVLTTGHFEILYPPL